RYGTGGHGAGQRAVLAEHGARNRSGDRRDAVVQAGLAWHQRLAACRTPPRVSGVFPGSSSPDSSQIGPESGSNPGGVPVIAASVAIRVLAATLVREVRASLGS